MLSNNIGASGLEIATKLGKEVEKEYRKRIELLAPDAEDRDFWEWYLEHDGFIIITEGAKKACSLVSNGYPAIGLNGIWGWGTNIKDMFGEIEKDGRGKSLKTLHPNLEPFVDGRELVLAFDRDANPDTVKTVDKAKSAFVSIVAEEGITVTDLKWRSPKGIDDYIFAKGVNALDRIYGNRSEVKPPQPHKPERVTAGDRLLEIAKTATYFQTPDRVAYTDIWIEGNRHTYPVRSKTFRLWLSGEYYKLEGKGMSSQTLQDTLNTLEAIALFEGQTHAVNLRTAEHQGKIFIDLGTPDWKAIEIDLSDWRLVSDPPVRFWRPDSLLPLPYPVAGGSLDELKELLNTAIDGVIAREDLGDRVLLATLGEITPDKRLSHSELNQKIYDSRPKIFGALLTALSHTLARLPQIQMAEPPRMADYALFSVAAEGALGLENGSFLTAFQESRERVRDAVIESSLVGEAILSFMRDRLVWKGTASELLKELESYTDEATYRSRYFPKSASILKRQLNRLSPDLRSMGIDVRDVREGKHGTRSIVLEKLLKVSSVPSADRYEAAKPLSEKTCTADGTADGTDDLLTTLSSADGIDDKLTTDKEITSAIQNETEKHSQPSADGTDGTDGTFGQYSGNDRSKLNSNDLEGEKVLSQKSDIQNHNFSTSCKPTPEAAHRTGGFLPFVCDKTIADWEVPADEF
jgi:Domain of unknown function (DUF3854)